MLAFGDRRTRPTVDEKAAGEEGGQRMDENDHPKGALLFMLVYLLLLAVLWTNAYLRLWTG
jgi:hypothetical protein